MPGAELVAGALVAGVTVGLTDTVQRVARDAWAKLVSVVRRERGDTVVEEHATDTSDESRPMNEPERGAQSGKYTVTVNEVKGALFGDNARQDNHFH